MDTQNGVLISGIPLTLTTALVRDKLSYLEVLVHEYRFCGSFTHPSFSQLNSNISNNVHFYLFLSNLKDLTDMQPSSTRNTLQLPRIP